MNEIVTARPTGLVARDVRRGVRAVRGEAAVRVARVQASTYVAAAGMQDVALIGTLEEAAIKQAPLAETRVGLLADGHAGACLAEIIRPWM